MSFFGKLLIVFQVVLSFCFMIFAGAVYTAQLNWKTKAETFSKQTDDAKSQLNTEKQQWDAERSDLQNQMTALRSDAESAKAALADTTTELKATQTQMRQEQTLKVSFSEESDLAKKEAEARREEAFRQREVNEKQHETLEELVEKVGKLQDQVFAMVKERESLERKHLAALEEIAVYKQVLSEHGLTTNPTEFVRSQAPPPVVRGFVTGSRAANDRGTETLVEISLGERDGLVAGHELFVYRPASRNDNRGMYLGKIKLISVTPNRGVGTVIERAKTGIIEKDDHVTTKL